MTRAGATLTTLLGLAVRAAAEPPMTTLAPKSDFAHWTQALYLQVIGWDAFILILVCALLAWGLFRSSTRAGDAPLPPPAARERLDLEVAWTVGPALVLLAIAVPTIRVTFRSEPAVAPANALEVDVTAHQWWWEVGYPALAVHTANEIHLPVGRPARFVLRSADVIHSFWVPQLGGKRDVVPGHTNTLTLIPDTPGTYLGQCAEFCGLSHANMRLRVVVEAPGAFAGWAAHQATPAFASTEPGAVAGARVFATSPCVTCHTVAGTAAGNRGPDLTHLMSRTTIAGGTLANTPDDLAAWLLDPQALKPGAQMPELGLARAQLAPLVAYLESLD
ncbi:MAG TPA: cytochrome c oxidase subunit II [Candidatus Binatia bacterium]|nr:cytochrome c oxidase subunit II [Candidatus Binatia bacterium]